MVQIMTGVGLQVYVTKALHKTCEEIQAYRQTYQGEEY